MLLFRSEETVDRWCEAHEVPRRPLVNLEQLWHLAVTWYWEPPHAGVAASRAEEMVGIFASIGLEGPFWDPSADSSYAGG